MFLSLFLSLCCWGVLAENNSSADIRLVGGASRCSGTVEVRLRGEWRRVHEPFGRWDLEHTAAVCRDLDCGSAVSGGYRGGFPQSRVWWLRSDCVKESSVRGCVSLSDSLSSSRALEVECSGAQAENNSSAELRLVGGVSRCCGTVEIRLRGEWRRVIELDEPWDLEHTAVVCKDLDCGSAVYGEERYDFPQSHVWMVSSDCVKGSSMRECVSHSSSSSWGVDVMCSDFILNRPIISVSVSDGASELHPQGVRVQLGSKFRVKCFVEPQYPGGSFRLLSPAAPPAQNRTLPAVNHSAHFLFSDVDHAHKGNYTCVYLLQVFNHNFSSQSHTL
ncbi:hypothetical protein NL108_013793 [Boleophthalmus pectinirostris]|uniref:scavenger receptor cysteine-rich type 1 protein M130-like n=1 Tax=Boleophthalmus pectinirostris TaxID=150288 RepID=UPI0024305989|nr:scavenger receptor cysteine-rich type 1 protein M130-like [Boleophthalmus pectinirostris]KAJ0061911.1 hypothetical protein NL108_013793 [Boleophthalmus pectinirostris]